MRLVIFIGNKVINYSIHTFIENLESQVCEVEEELHNIQDEICDVEKEVEESSGDER